MDQVAADQMPQEQVLTKAVMELSAVAVVAVEMLHLEHPAQVAKVAPATA